MNGRYFRNDFLNDNLLAFWRFKHFFPWGIIVGMRLTGSGYCA